MTKNNDIISQRELFLRYAEIAEKQVETSRNIAIVLQRLTDKIEEANKLSKSKLYWIIGACLVIAGGAIGVKLILP